MTAVRTHLEEIRRQSALLLQIRLDRLRIHARRVGVAFVAGFLGLLVVVTLCIAAALALVAGVAGAFADLFERAWAGQLAAGVLFFVLFGGGLAVVRARQRRATLARLRAKYENGQPLREAP